MAAAGDERYLICAAVAAAVGLPFFLLQCNGGLKLLWVCLCVRSYRVFWNLRLQIRMVMAASRLLGAAAACVILLSLQLKIVNRIGVAASRLR